MGKGFGNANLSMDGAISSLLSHEIDHSTNPVNVQRVTEQQSGVDSEIKVEPSALDIQGKVIKESKN
jgi:hypothetical protein